MATLPMHPDAVVRPAAGIGGRSRAPQPWSGVSLGVFAAAIIAGSGIPLLGGTSALDGLRQINER